MKRGKRDIKPILIENCCGSPGESRKLNDGTSIL
jgi:hypothetical protein